MKLRGWRDGGGALGQRALYRGGAAGDDGDAAGAGRLQLEEIFQQAFAFRGEDGFRVELHAVDGEGLMLQAHDFALGCFGGDFEDVREGVALDDEGVVSRGFEGGREIFEDALALVNDGGGFAVHETVGPDHVSAVDFADALVVAVSIFRIIL